jgi:dipeptide transport system ATP-binding protein
MILEAKGLTKHYKAIGKFGLSKTVKALDGVSFELNKGKTLGIVGESGCGKSTLARALMGIDIPTSGDVLFNNKPVSELSRTERQASIQMVFQDPYSSLNPRKEAWRLVAEPLLINTNKSRNECMELAVSAMKKVGLGPEFTHRYPHMLSGGQRQRLGIARALVLNPKILILDEPISALDVSIQAQVLNLLIKLQDELKLTYIFISHDLSVVRHFCDDVLVMYLGKTVETGAGQAIFSKPQHPYTKALLASSPSLEKSGPSEILKGELPSPLDPPPGCAFHKRCPIAVDKCKSTAPTLWPKGGHHVSCHEVR